MPLLQRNNEKNKKKQIKKLGNLKLVPTSFIYPVITDADRNYGVIEKIVRPDGDWRKHQPPTEHQNVRGIESSACYVEGEQHAIASLLEAEYGVIDDNYSSRFNALLSYGTPNGGDPVAAAYSINHHGLIPDSMMPFGYEIENWDDFHSWKGVSEDECKKKGKDYLQLWELNYKIEVERDFPIATKYLLLKKALTKSPVPISVYAWYQNGDVYIKPEGARDNHLVEAVYLDEQNRVHVRDTYEPFDKILAPNFDFDFAMSWSAQKKTSKPKLTWLQLICRFFGKKV